MLQYAQLESYVSQRVAELRREADNDRLADLAAGPGRSLRHSVARWLIVTASWIEGSPQPPLATASVR